MSGTLSSNEYKVIYIRIPGNTAPECDDYAKKILSLSVAEGFIGYKDYNFWRMMREKGFIYPRGMRWCSQRFKYAVFQRIASEAEKPVLFITGVKGGDRPLRAMTVKEFQEVKLWKAYALAPLKVWDSEDIWEYIRMRGLEVNPLYAEVGHSANCIYCPFLRKAAFFASMRKWPEVAWMLKRLVENPPRPTGKWKRKGMEAVKGSYREYQKLKRWLRQLEEESFEFIEPEPDSFVYEGWNGSGEIIIEEV